MKYKIYNQDVIEWSKSYEKQKFHALLSDAPYELNFMGQKWDRSGVAFRPETWAALGEHLYPGAFGMCFSASRNWHRLAVAIEDAGMIIHPTIFGWLNGQGFPKATNISKQLEKGKPNGKITSITGGRKSAFAELRNDSASGFYGDGKVNYELEFETETAQRWEGHRYGLQALKPAVEPIIVFQKPYEGKPLDNIVETGAGALNIDGGRIATNQDDLEKFKRLSGFNNTQSIGGNGMYQGGEIMNRSEYDGTKGRWPSNFVLDESSAEKLDAQTGTLTSGKPSGKKHADNNIYGKYKNEDIDVRGIGDSGGASRFFFNVQEQIDEADPIYYCGKVSPKERNAGLDNEPEKKSMAQEVLERGGTSKIGNHNPVCQKCGGSKIDRGNGVCKCETPEWLARNTATVRCNHPTMKPIALAKYLATLLLPPEEYAPRRILVPFAGVASEMIGCALAGWEHIVGIEFDTENGYVDIAHKRMEYWTNK